jgi:DNA-binding response OmpR family regulator
VNSRTRGESNVTGGAHLARRSALLKRIHGLGLHIDLLIVEDRSQDAHFITKPLGRLFGEHAKLSIAPTVDDLKIALGRGTYTAIILDDRMDAGATADLTFPLIRAAGHEGPILVVSGILTNARRAELKRLGAEIVLTKDELDSVELGDRILRALGHPAS